MQGTVKRCGEQKNGEAVLPVLSLAGFLNAEKNSVTGSVRPFSRVLSGILDIEWSVGPIYLCSKYIHLKKCSYTGACQRFWLRS